MWEILPMMPIAKSTAKRKATRTRSNMEVLIFTPSDYNFKWRIQTFFQPKRPYLFCKLRLFAGKHQVSFSGGIIRPEIFYFNAHLVYPADSLFTIVRVADIEQSQDHDKGDLGQMPDGKSFFKVIFQLHLSLQPGKYTVALFLLLKSDAEFIGAHYLIPTQKIFMLSIYVPSGIAYNFSPILILALRALLFFSTSSFVGSIGFRFTALKIVNGFP